VISSLRSDEIIAKCSADCARPGLFLNSAADAGLALKSLNADKHIAGTTTAAPKIRQRLRLTGIFPSFSFTRGTSTSRHNPIFDSTAEYLVPARLDRPGARDLSCPSASRALAEIEELQRHRRSWTRCCSNPSTCRHRRVGH